MRTRSTSPLGEGVASTEHGTTALPRTTANLASAQTFEDIVTLLIQKEKENKDEFTRDENMLNFLCNRMAQEDDKEYITTFKADVEDALVKRLKKKYANKQSKNGQIINKGEIHKFVTGIVELLKARRYQELGIRGKSDHYSTGLKKLQDVAIPELAELGQKIVEKINSGMEEKGIELGSPNAEPIQNVFRNATVQAPKEMTAKQAKLTELKKKWEEGGPQETPFKFYFPIHALMAAHLDANDGVNFYGLNLWLTNESRLCKSPMYKKLKDIRGHIDDLLREYLGAWKKLGYMEERITLGANIIKLYEDLSKEKSSKRCKIDKEYKSLVKQVKDDMIFLKYNHEDFKIYLQKVLTDINSKAITLRDKISSYRDDLTRHAVLNADYQQAFNEREEIIRAAYLPLRKFMQNLWEANQGNLPVDVDKETEEKIISLVHKLDQAVKEAANGASVLRAAGKTEPLPPPEVALSFQGRGGEQKPQCNGVSAGGDMPPSAKDIIKPITRPDDAAPLSPVDPSSPEEKPVRQPKKSFFAKKQAKVALGLIGVGVLVTLLAAIPGIQVTFVALAVISGLAIILVASCLLFQAAKKDDRKAAKRNDRSNAEYGGFFRRLRFPARKSRETVPINLKMSPQPQS
ncbi:MAG: hypothetical protein C5B47_02560 [Verrucomicrobia bacterium]|nr:MAG: hypothetical protein C5B47_02560 [Verrucomicrobiota bacterium]